MIIKIGDNIFSPLGIDSQSNYDSVKRGRIGGHYYERLYGLHEPCFVSLFENAIIESQFSTLMPHNKLDRDYTRFEKLMLISALKALKPLHLNTSSGDVVFILSTTKGNIRLLESGVDSERVNLWSSAQRLAYVFDLPQVPIVVSNACISGVAAQILAMDYLNSQRYRYAVVIGAEELSRFIISGFQSFKALSPTQCKPFDKNRIGLNLGEASATIVYQRIEDATAFHNTFALVGAGMCNDANHISAPSRVGAGLLRALQSASANIDLSRLAFINAHGTATPYNDDMEANAIARANLSDVPVNSLKGYFGHTLGAAGVLETIISSYALADRRVLPTAGYSTFGVVCPIHVNDTLSVAHGDMFMKLISGFGGSNAAAIYQYLK